MALLIENSRIVHISPSSPRLFKTGAHPSKPYRVEERTIVFSQEEMSGANRACPVVYQIVNSEPTEVCAVQTSVPSLEGCMKDGDIFPIDRVTQYLLIYILPPPLLLTRKLDVFLDSTSTDWTYI